MDHTGKLQLADTRRVWWDGWHNAFTDITEFKGRYFIAFRHSTAHVGAPGRVFVAASADLRQWEHAATISAGAGADDRDPKFVHCQGKLGVFFFSLVDVNACASGVTHICWSTDGANYSAPQPISARNVWIWKITPFQGAFYGSAYSFPVKGGDWASYLFRSEDGLNFTKVSTIVQGQCANECHALFKQDGTCYVIVRRETKEIKPCLAVSRPPYLDWRLHELDVQLQGPHIFEFKGRTYLAGRLFPPGLLPKTGILELDLASLKLSNQLLLESRGWDTSYTGTLIKGDRLYVSYYSRDPSQRLETRLGENATGIFLAALE